MAEFDPFSGDGLDTLELLWEPCVNKFGMAPPLVVCCVSQNDSVSVSAMRLNGLGDHEVESPARPMSFKLVLLTPPVRRPLKLMFRLPPLLELLEFVLSR